MIDALTHALQPERFGLSLEGLLSAVKLAAVILTGGLAIYGLRVEYKDSEGRITKAGKWALGGLIVSTVVAVVSQGLETEVKRRDDKAAAERTRGTLEEIRRAVYPIRDVYITLNMLVPSDALEGYSKRLETVGPGMAMKRKNSDTSVDEDEHGRVTAYLTETSPLYPKIGSVERAVLVNAAFKFRFYKTAVDLKATSPAPAADLEFVIRPRHPSIEYQSRRRRYQIVAANVQAERTQWRSNGRIASLADLGSALLIISLEDVHVFPEMSETKLRLTPLSVDIDIGGRQLFLAAGLSSTPNERFGRGAFSFRFPEKMLEVDEDLGQDKAKNEIIRAQAYSASYVIPP